MPNHAFNTVAEREIRRCITERLGYVAVYFEEKSGDASVHRDKDYEHAGGWRLLFTGKMEKEFMLTEQSRIN